MKTWGSKITLFGVAIGVVACGGTRGGMLLPGSGGGAEDTSGLTSIDIALPDRDGLKSQVADIEDKMNGYHLKITSTGAGCTNVDEVKPYATATLGASLKQGCDYTIQLSLGQMSADTDDDDADQTQEEKITYEDNLKQLVDGSCATAACHNGSNSLSNLSTYAGLKAAAAGSVTRVQSGAMPKGGSFSAAEKKLFQDWQADGLLEKAEASTTTSTTTSNAASLSAVYYKNNTAKAVAKTEIQGKAKYDIDLRLNLQAAGQAIGLGSGTDSPDPTEPGPTVPTEPTGPELPEAKDPDLTGASGATELSKIFKGEYMLIDFSQSTCGFCRERAEELNASAALQAYFAGGKCSHATIVPTNDLGAWNRVIGGASTYTGKHSYSLTSGRLTDYMNVIAGGNRGTPTFILIDSKGNRMGELGHTFPTDLLNQYCR